MGGLMASGGTNSRQPRGGFHLDFMYSPGDSKPSIWLLRLATLTIVMFFSSVR